MAITGRQGLLEGVRLDATYPPIDLVLVSFALLLDHEQCMVKQEDQEFSTIALRTAATLQGAFIYHLTTLFLQPQILSAKASQLD